jgi:microcystin-dependent protein
MEAYIGTIMTVAFPFAPSDWALCQGQLIAISQNTALFALLGTTYGGNGTSTFQLPDFRGRVPVGQGQGPGLSFYDMGEIAGTENISLLTSNLPSHTHTATFTPTGGSGPVSVTIKASANQATESIPGTNNANVLASYYYGDGSAAVNDYVVDANPGVTLGGVTATGGGGSGTVTNGMNGNSLPTPLMQPFLTLNYIIALYGIFPSRN